MHLLVGELASRSGLTVRMLHHFDQIGLLKPSARPEGGYRLYSRDDVARLHGIQALRHLGLPIKQIGEMLAGDGADLPAIVARQVRALDHEISQATDLRGQLQLMLDRYAGGGQPEMADLLGSLALMTTYARYFNPDEIKTIVGNRRSIESEWRLHAGDGGYLDPAPRGAGHAGPGDERVPVHLHGPGAAVVGGHRQGAALGVTAHLVYSRWRRAAGPVNAGVGALADAPRQR